MSPAGGWTVVIPTVGRPSLTGLLASLAAQDDRPDAVLVVDDRADGADRAGALDVSAFPGTRVLNSGGRGPAAARNLGRRHALTAWVVVLDDDVLLPPRWSRGLRTDLASAGPEVAAVAGRITVPLPADRRPTDWERTTSGLETAWGATADMAFRRRALAAVGGFDERFPRAYREDADLAARLVAAGWVVVRGTREVIHPVRPAGFWISLRTQRGNADDALMRAVHGSRWRETTRCPRGRFRTHLATVVAAVVAAAATLRRDHAIRPAATGAAHRPLSGADCMITTGWVGLAVAVGLTVDFARRRIAPGPRTPRELATMGVTSVLIPPAAVFWRAVGSWRHRRAGAWPPVIRAVLLDRDGTLVHDVPYNGHPDRVRPVDGAAAALDRLREAGLRLATVSNQSGIGRGLLTTDDVRRVEDRVEQLLGPFDHREVCPHTDADGCDCRKPRPGMIVAAARALGVHPWECVVIGDIGADVDAARAAGAWSVLVPAPTTRPEEVASADVVAGSLGEAVDVVLAGDLHRRAVRVAELVNGVPR